MRGLALLSLTLVASCGQVADRTESNNEALSAKDAVFVQTFVSTCVRDFHGRDRVRAAAEALEWKPITDRQMRQMLGPDNGSSNWQGWMFEQQGQKFMLALTDTMIDQKPGQNCVVIGELESVAGTKAHLTKLLSAKDAQREEDAGQVTEVRKFMLENDPLLLSFIDGEPMGMKILNAGVSTDWTNR